MQRTDTAHEVWDDTWKSDDGRADWLAPEEEVVNLLPTLRNRKCRKVLDLGCGVGRHAHLLAKEGFEVTAIDLSTSGLDFLQQESRKSQLQIQTVCGEMTTLPFEDQSFDYVLSWNVIYHGNEEVVQQAISEIHRVLIPGGYFQGTMLSNRHAEIQTGEEISPGTFIQAENGEKSHPHYYCGEDKLRELFGSFTFLSLEEPVHNRPESYHWHLLVERKGTA